MTGGARPPSIAWFERIVLLSLVVALLSMVLTWDRLLARMPPDLRQSGGGAAIIVIFAAIVFALLLLLLYFVSRRRSRIARWIYIAYYGLSLAAAPVRPATALYWGPVPAALTIVQYACIAATLWLLFRRDARDWFAGRASVDPEIFR